jgi:hypothetical protein
MSFKIDDFRAVVASGGARPNLFRVMLNFPTYAQGDVQLASFLCNSAQIPSAQTGTANVSFRGQTLKLGGEKTFNDWQVSVINTTDFALRNAMERWSNGIRNHSSARGRARPADYMVDASVQQLDRDESVLAEYKFVGMWPSSIDAIALSYASADQVQEFNVSFSYQYWTRVDQDGIIS